MVQHSQIDGFYDIEECTLYPYTLKGFNQERMLYFVKCFFCINREDHMILVSSFFIFLRILFIHSTEIETASERGNTNRGSGRGRSRLPAEEPNVGLDPRTLGSHPEAKADA